MAVKLVEPLQMSKHNLKDNVALFVMLQPLSPAPSSSWAGRAAIAPNRQRGASCADTAADSSNSASVTRVDAHAARRAGLVAAAVAAAAQLGNAQTGQDDPRQRHTRQAAHSGNSGDCNLRAASAAASSICCSHSLYR